MNKKYLFLVEKKSTQKKIEDFFNKNKELLDYDADFISFGTYVYPPLDSVVSLSEGIEQELVNVSNYLELPNKFYLLYPSKVKIIIEEVKIMIEQNNYDYIINAFDSDISGVLLFEYVLKELNVNIPTKTLYMYNLTNESLLNSFTSLKDTMNHSSEIVKNWLCEYDNKTVKLNEMMGKDFVVKRELDGKNSEKLIKIDDVWTLVKCDDNFMIHMKKKDKTVILYFSEFCMCFNCQRNFI